MKRLRTNMICCVPVHRSNSNLFIASDIGLPRRTSTPLTLPLAELRILDNTVEMPLVSPFVEMPLSTPLAHLPPSGRPTVVGLPKQTSTPLATLTVPLEISDISQSSIISAAERPAISSQTSPLIPAPHLKRTFIKKKSNPIRKRKAHILPSKLHEDSSYVLPGVPEEQTEHRVCDVNCIVCAFARPELRANHHSAALGIF